MLGKASVEIGPGTSEPRPPAYGFTHVTFALGLLLLGLSLAAGGLEIASRGEVLKLHTDPWADARLRATSGQTDAAIRQYLVAARVDVSGDWAWVQAGNLLRETQRGDEAGAAYEAALGVDARSPGAHAGLGDLALDRGDLTLASSHFLNALRANPGAAAYHNSLGVVYASARKYDDAIREFEAAYALKPEALFRANLERAQAERTALAHGAPSRP